MTPETTPEPKAAEIVPDIELSPKTEERSTSNLHAIATPLAIVVAGLLVAGSVLYTSDRQAAQLAVAPTGGVIEQAAPPAPAVDINMITTKGEPFIGNPDAPVTIAYWYDYQCSYCQRHEQQVMPQMIKEYVDTGKAKIVFKDYAFLGPGSTALALASHAVWEVAPDKFFAWHTMIFDNLGKEHGSWEDHENILKLTKNIPGIDTAKVAALMASKAAEYQSGMESDQAEGSLVGVTGTPAFVMGHELVMGAQPYPLIKAAIDTALNAKD